MIDWDAMSARTERLMAEYDVRAEGAHVPIRTLSGGNQQKLVLARELELDSSSERALVVENPTRGLDIRATAAVRERLRSAAAAGAGVVVFSSDLDEVLALAERVVVLHGGSATECARNREAVGQAMLGM